MSVARNHHYVPQGYLAAFTSNAARDGRLIVTDFVSRRSFTTVPRNVAAERDFNRVDVEGHPADAVEKQFAVFEDAAATAIRSIDEEGRLSYDQRLNLVINLITLLTVRNPRFRREMANAIKRSTVITSDLLVSKPEIYDRVKSQARECGYITEDVDFETMKSFVEGRRFEIEIPNEALLRHELEIFDSVLPVIGRRHWALVEACEAQSEFITCDHPAALYPRDQTLKGPYGLETPGTEILFPLSPRFVLSGLLVEQGLEKVVLNGRGVAIINTHVIEHAHRQVYSRSSSAVFLRNREVTQLDDFSFD